MKNNQENNSANLSASELNLNCLTTTTSQIKSKQRIADHGEVFTPPWLVEAMLDIVQGEADRIDARILEPACGNGNFLIPALHRKLAAVDIKYGKSDFERRHYALLSVMCIYGIELLVDNISECKANLLAILFEYLNLDSADEIFLAASYVLSENIVHGDALKMCTTEGKPITFAEWGYLGKGKFQRRDFRLDTLTQSAAWNAKGDMFATLNRNDIFQPVESYPPITITNLAKSYLGKRN